MDSFNSFNPNKLNKKFLFVAFFIFLYFLTKQSREKSILDNNFKNIKQINLLKNLIIKLNKYSHKSKKTNIIFTDLFLSKSCYDKNSFILFDYCINNHFYNPYYIVNNESDFYFSLIEQNKTKNLILYNAKNNFFFDDLYKYLKDALIIITSYNIELLKIISSFVPYLKFLKINHGIRYFKVNSAKIEINPLWKKVNFICSSPLEYKLLKELNYSMDKIHNASLPRYERFQFIKKNKKEKKCILVSFTYRSYNNSFFEKSIYKTNLEEFVNDIKLITYLTYKNIDLIYIPHHEEIDLEKNYSQNIFAYAKVKNQRDLEYYIEQCSLFITDFSSISFDFMFQNKPVLFYLLDRNEKDLIRDKMHFAQIQDLKFFGNYYFQKNLLIKKIEYYINRDFDIEHKLKKKYESIFFLKKNIIRRLIEIIDKIIKE